MQGTQAADFLLTAEWHTNEHPIRFQRPFKNLRKKFRHGTATLAGVSSEQNPVLTANLGIVLRMLWRIAKDYRISKPGKIGRRCHSGGSSADHRNGIALVIHIIILAAAPETGAAIDFGLTFSDFSCRGNRTMLQ